ncbi:hypothetical protein QN345_14575, partial [Cryobacterium sp. 10I1]|uniref:hypothetical protein n=1 Tax=Cryobacterium sp. 10I1 TaxID=3048578 RepID=UPI002B2231E7
VVDFSLSEVGVRGDFRREGVHAAEVVSHQAGGIALDTLFVDEGFGSLDSETLETAMSTLDGLRAGGRTIGLISHVDSMKEQIPAKLEVTVTDQGFSEIGSTVLV